MKLPRGVSARLLIRALEQLGYIVTRQKGSHCRMRHKGPPPHSVTVPLHDPLKTGTLHAIIGEVAEMRSVATESIVEML